MTLVDGLAPPSSQAAGVDLGGPCASRLDASARHPPAIAIVGRLCEHYIPNHQRQPHITTVYAFDHTRQITANVCAFRVLLHGVARVTDFQTACSEAAHGNRRMPFCALLPSCRTPPSLLRSTLPRPRRRFRAAHSRVGQPGSAAPGWSVELLHRLSIKIKSWNSDDSLTVRTTTIFCHGQFPCELPRSLCKTNAMQCREL